MSDALDRIFAAFDQGVGEIADSFGALEPLRACQEATDFSRRIGEALRHRITVAAQLRAQAVTRLRQEEQLSLGQLAERLGISKARADQLVRFANDPQTDVPDHG